MMWKRLAVLALGVCGVLQPASAQDPKPSPENAHAFLKAVLTKGSSSAEAHHRVNGRIQALESSACQSGFSGGYAEYPTESGLAFWNVSYRFTVDWGKVSEVSSKGNQITLRGAFPYSGTCSTNARMGCEPTYAGTASVATITLESDSLTERVVKAMALLKSNCDTTAQFGF